LLKTGKLNISRAIRFFGVQQLTEGALASSCGAVCEYNAAATVSLSLRQVVCRFGCLLLSVSRKDPKQKKRLRVLLHWHFCFGCVTACLFLYHVSSSISGTHSSIISIFRLSCRVHGFLFHPTAISTFVSSNRKVPHHGQSSSSALSYASQIFFNGYVIIRLVLFRRLISALVFWSLRLSRKNKNFFPDFRPGNFRICDGSES